jgi:hypothetical protein
MISIRFKDYFIDQQIFNRLADHAAIDGVRSRLFEPLDEALMDAMTEYQALQRQHGQEQDIEKKHRLEKELKDYPEKFVRIPMKTIPRVKLNGLNMPLRIWRIMTKHKVIGK